MNGAEQKGWTEREKETPQTPRNRPALGATADTSLLSERIHQLDQARSSGRRSKEHRTNSGQVAAGEEPRARERAGEETTDGRAPVLPLRRQREQGQVAAPEQETAAKISRFSIVQVSPPVLRARGNSGDGDWQVRRGEWVVGLASSEQGFIC